MAPGSPGYRWKNSAGVIVSQCFESRLEGVGIEVLACPFDGLAEQHGDAYAAYVKAGQFGTAVILGRDLAGQLDARGVGAPDLSNTTTR